MTGSLNNITRTKAKESLERHNAHLTTSVSRNTNFLILGNNPGSKFEKAKQLNIKIINEKEFLNMLENS